MIIALGWWHCSLRNQAEKQKRRLSKSCSGQQRTHFQPFNNFNRIYQGSCQARICSTTNFPMPIDSGSIRELFYRTSIFNSFIEIPLTYHIVDPFKYYNSGFCWHIQSCATIIIIYITFLSPPKETYLLAVSPHSPHSTGKHYSFYLCRIVCSGCLILMESYTTWLFMTGF